MIRMKYFLILTSSYLLFAVSPSFGEATWEAANEAYQKAKYEEAKVDYIQIAGTRQYSADLFYNLGNAWFKLGDQGRAILNYERALILNPRLEEARSNSTNHAQDRWKRRSTHFSRADRSLCGLLSLDRFDRFLDCRVLSPACLAESRAVRYDLAFSVHLGGAHLHWCRGPDILGWLRFKRSESGRGCRTSD